MTLTATTKLQAINVMLSVIGESPTNSLAGTLPYEVDLAETILDETIRETLMDSFVFNTELDVSVTPDGSDHLIAQSNWIRVNPSDGTAEYILRETSVGSGQYLVYDITNKTSTFSSVTELNVVYLLEFADLPEACKRYCMIRAARIYADRLMASKDVRAFSQVDEYEAKAKLMNYEVGVDKFNVLYDTPDNYSFLRRRPR